MDNTTIKPIYFFHIPKTSGRYIFANVFNILKYDLIEKRGQASDKLKTFGHRALTPIDNNEIFSLLILRDPVQRTISHYLHIYEKKLTNNIKKDKKMFFKFLNNENGNKLKNYQCKYISYSGKDEFIDIYSSNLPNETNQSIIKSRISKVDLLMKTEEINKNSVEYIFKISEENLNLQSRYKKVNVHYPTIINKESKILYDSLSKKEIVKLEEFLDEDMDLYHSCRFDKLV